MANKFKVGDLVVYRKGFEGNRPYQLSEYFVYKIQDIDEYGYCFLLPINNYLGICGDSYCESTWTCSPELLVPLAERPDCEWGEEELKMYGEQPPSTSSTQVMTPTSSYVWRVATAGLHWDESSSLKVTHDTGLCGYNPIRRSSLQEDIKNHG